MACQFCLEDNCQYYASFQRDPNCFCHLKICNECAPNIKKCLACGKQIKGFLIDKDIERLNEDDKKKPFICPNCDLVVKRRELPDHACLKKPKIVDLTNEPEDIPLAQLAQPKPPAQPKPSPQLKQLKACIFTNNDWLTYNLLERYNICNLSEKIQATFICIVVISHDAFRNIASEDEDTGNAKIITTSRYETEDRGFIDQSAESHTLTQNISLKKINTQVHRTEISYKWFTPEIRNAVGSLVKNGGNWAIFVMSSELPYIVEFVKSFYVTSVEQLTKMGVLR